MNTTRTPHSSSVEQGARPRRVSRLFAAATAAFAVATIRRWFHQIGKDACPGADRLLVCADGGGSNGYRTRLWKTELAALAASTGLRNPS